MLPPQLQHSLRQRSLSAASSLALRSIGSAVLRSAPVHAQARSFWGWRRPRDYDSRHDPIFYRFCRYRTLQTRAKLLDKLRRRGRWEWDVNQRPFFSPRHIRLASHIGRPKWRNSEDGKQTKDVEEKVEDDGLELSQREREWKDQMESMRKRIELDPYEAVFGKRFEPFWGPLVPSWMREEMGLSRRPKHAKETPTASSVESSKQPSHGRKAASDSIKPAESMNLRQPKKEPENEAESPNGQLTNYSYSSKKSLADADPDSPNGQLTNYSYASSTSWDSWTQKTRREEWDSISGETRRYEYDPISNRMVQIAASEAVKDELKLGTFPDKPKPVSQQPQKATTSEAVNIPVKTSHSLRTAIPVPTQTTAPHRASQKTSVYFPSLLNTSVVSNAVKPSALAKIPEKDLELLTADDVRASVGKDKQLYATESSPEALAQSRAYRNGKLDPAKSEWDQAETRTMLDHELNTLAKKKQKLLNHEHGLFHIERQKKELVKLDERIAEVEKQLEDVDNVQTKNTSANPLNSFAELRRQLLAKYDSRPKLETALDRSEVAAVSHTQTASETTAQTLQPSLERMTSKERPATAEPDDSAAHESTGDPVNYKATNVPKHWEKQADLLQADRIKRTRDIDTNTNGLSSHSLTPKEAQNIDLEQLPKTESPGPKVRWIEVMNARKAAYNAQKALEKAATEARDAATNAKLEKANEMLQAEVQEQKFLMQAHENRYTHKIQSLRRDLDTAYKQSSTNSEMHVDRIRALEQELANVQKAAGDTSAISKFQSERERFQKKIKDLRAELDTAYSQSCANAEMQVERIQYLEKELDKARKRGSSTSQHEKERYMKKVQALREELDIAFKQSAVQGEKHVERIRELEKEVERVRSQINSSTNGTEGMQAEGDMSANVTKFAKDSSKWYKQSAYRPDASGTPDSQELDGAAKKARDRALVKEVRDIYESRYGTIDVNHRQGQSQPARAVRKRKPQVVEVETDVDLGKALADYEKEQTYQFRRDNLEAEIAAQEKEAHEAQALMSPETSSKMRHVISNRLALDQDVHGARIVDDTVPRLIPTEVSARTERSAQETANIEHESTIAWEEPPLYKVLAYDSGNDMFSTATTSSNFTGNENPISIAKALSQLYQPARFVPLFAELQTEGYQVIHGAKDLLVFKKVKSTSNNATRPGGRPALEDHGLVRPATGVNPIDGTTHVAEPNTGVSSSTPGSIDAGWDALASSEGQIQSPSTVSQPPQQTQTDSEPPVSSAPLQSPRKNYSQPADEADTEIRHYPRVKREERVFSGGRLLKPKRERKRHHHEPSQEQIREWRQKWRSYRSRMRWAVGVGLGASVVAYAVGAAAEKKEMKEKERWQQILEGKRARWE